MLLCLSIVIPLFNRTDPPDRKTEGGHLSAFPAGRISGKPKNKIKYTEGDTERKSLTKESIYFSLPVLRFSLPALLSTVLSGEEVFPTWLRRAFGLASQEEPLGAEPDKPGHEELASDPGECGAGTKMRKSRVYRMVLATCLGSLLLVIFYFQSSLNPGELNIYPAVPSPFFASAPPEIETMKRLVALQASSRVLLLARPATANFRHRTDSPQPTCCWTTRQQDNFGCGELAVASWLWQIVTDVSRRGFSYLLLVNGDKQASHS
ncbi:Carbohydrate sulfotransferase 11, partial [Ophiophagus hannah]